MCLCRYQRGCRSLAANLQLCAQSPRQPTVHAETPAGDGDCDVPEEVESVIGGCSPCGLWSLGGGEAPPRYIYWPRTFATSVLAARGLP